MVVNDDLLSMCLNGGSFIAAALITGILVALGHGLELGLTYIDYAAVLVTAWLTIHVMMSTVDSAVTSVIVCYADFPLELQTNHPEAYHKLTQTWMEVHPDAMTGYTL